MTRRLLALGLSLVAGSCKDAESNMRSDALEVLRPDLYCVEITFHVEMRSDLEPITSVCYPRAVAERPQPGGWFLTRTRALATLPPGMHCAERPGYAPLLDSTGGPVLRMPSGWSAPGEVCRIAQVPLYGDGAPNFTIAADGFYYDRRVGPFSATCYGRFAFTTPALPPMGAIVEFSTLEGSSDRCQGSPLLARSSAATFGRACSPEPAPPYGGLPSCARDAGCYLPTETLIAELPECEGLACVVYRWDQALAPEQRAIRELCTCRCADENGAPVPSCACPADYRCVAAAGEVNSPRLRGSYCIPAAAAPLDLDAGL